MFSIYLLIKMQIPIGQIGAMIWPFDRAAEPTLGWVEEGGAYETGLINIHALANGRRPAAMMASDKMANECHNKSLATV